MKVRDDFLRRKQIAIGGKPDDVGEEHDDILVASWRHGLGLLKLVHSLRWQDRMKERLGATPLTVNFGEVAEFLIVQSLLLKAGSHACSQECWVERLGQVIL